MQTLNSKDFDAQISKGVVVVDFFATWCGPCKMMAPILEEVEADLEGKVKFFKVDVDENESLARKFGVLSIPTVIIFENGELREKHIGLWQHEEAFDLINSYVK